MTHGFPEAPVTPIDAGRQPLRRRDDLARRSARRRDWLLALGYPPLVTIALIITFVGGSTEPLIAAGRLVVLLVTTSLALTIGIGAIARSIHAGSLIAAPVMCFVVGERELGLLLGIPTAVWILIPIAKFRRLALRDWRLGSRVMGVAAPLFATISLLVTLLTSSGALPGSVPAGSPIAPTAETPDIFMIMLDGYPRNDSLATLGYDNRSFTDGLAALGLTVSTQARSNYDATPLTLITTFDMRHAAEIPAVQALQDVDAADQYRGISAAIRDARSLDILRHHGYEIISVPSEWTSLRIGADRRIEFGRLNNLEIMFLGRAFRAGAAADLVASWTATDHREQIGSTLAMLPRLAAEPRSRPRFVFAHVLSPHAPPVVRADGSPQDGWPCWPRECSFWAYGLTEGHDAVADALVNQIRWLNPMVLGAISGIQRASPTPPVIIVFSDHGARYSSNDVDERFRSLLATSTPGRPGLYPDDAVDVQIMTTLLNGYLHLHLPEPDAKTTVEAIGWETNGLLGNVFPKAAP